jgi:hypothetical protein
LLLQKLDSQIPDAAEANGKASDGKRHGSATDSGSRGEAAGKGSGADRLQQYREQRAKTERRQQEQGKVFVHVERVLQDQTIDEDTAAKELLGIVLRGDLGIDERFEAMVHGLILEPKVFSQLAAEANLPAPLAGRLLDEFANLNGDRDLQVRACMALLGHHDGEVSERCRELLAFYAGLEDRGTMSDPELLDAASKYLESLSNPASPEQSAAPTPNEAESAGTGNDPEGVPAEAPELVPSARNPDTE